MRAEQPVGAPLLEFLRRARRRYLTREFLGASFASAAASLLLELAIVRVDRRFGLEVPVVSIGIVLFIVLGALVLRRNRVVRVAARADRGLRLQDRLATFLDFRGRADVGQDFRSAQAVEAAAVLARTDLTRGIPIPRLLWAAPLLFGWMLYLDYFTFFVPFTPPFIQQIVRVVDPHRPALHPGAEPEDDAAGERGEKASPAPPLERAASSPGETPTVAPGDGKQPDGEDRPGDPGAADTGDQGERLAAIPAMISEPAKLYSEPVGRSLTPVADAAPGSSPAAPAATPELPLRGRISFNLVPVDGTVGGPAGTGTEPGGGATEGLEVTIDYDAVPPEYRTQVRRYFNALVRLFQGGNDGT